MNKKIGLVGFPNAGKSSLFNLLTGLKATVGDYPFTTIDPNVGIMEWADHRLEKLSVFYHSQKTTSSLVQIVDIAGLIKGAAEGLGLGNEFLSHIRGVDLICYVLRCFRDPNITHVEEEVDAARDFESLSAELILSDLQQVEKRLSKLKVRDESSEAEKRLLEKIKAELERGKPVNEIEIESPNCGIIKSYNLLTSKPSLVVANYETGEELKEIDQYLKKKSIAFFPLSVATELKKKTSNSNSINSLTEGIKKALKLKVFFTAGAKESKSWLAPQDWKAYECAGLIHSEIGKKCAGVKVCNFDEWWEDKNKQKQRREKKNYLVKEGDICVFL